MRRALGCARRRCSEAAAAAPRLSVGLHAWDATAAEADEAVRAVREAVSSDVKAGNGGAIRVVGAKSAVAVAKGLALAEAALGTGEVASPLGVDAKLRLALSADPADYHTFTLRYTAEGHRFPRLAKVVDVLDKAELPESLYDWAGQTPTGTYNEQRLDVDYDPNNPEWQKQYVFSGSELTELLVRNPRSEAVVRGMGPSLFNCFKVIAHAQAALRAELPFGVVKVEADGATVAVFKDNIRDYFERGMVHFRDRTEQPAAPADGRIWTPPEGHKEEDHFTAAFGVRFA